MLATVWCKRSIVATAFIARDVHLNIRVINCGGAYEGNEGKLNVFTLQIIQINATYKIVIVSTV